MFRRVVTGVVVALLVVVAIGLLPASVANHADEEEPQLTTPEGFTNAEFEIRIFENGSARWTVRASRPLSTANQTEMEQFREFEQRFESTETTAFLDFKANARELTAIGTDVTGRQMNATGFAREARVSRLGQTRGIVELSFVWTNLAVTDGREVRVGDIFDGGFFIDTDQRLIVRRGPNLVFESASPPPDSQAIEDNLTASDTVTWLGEQRFPDNRPRVVLVPPEAVSPGSETPTVNGSVTGTATVTATPAANATSPGGFGVTALVAVVVLVVLGLGGGFAWYTGAIAPDTRQGGGATSTGSTTTTTTRTTQTPQPSEPAIPDEEFLSDEERVLQLLEQNGGRMKQVKIVDETDWSKSKVSMLLSDMEDEGQISKLRVGRENIISIAGEEPEAAESPFDEE